MNKLKKIFICLLCLITCAFGFVLVGCSNKNDNNSNKGARWYSGNGEPNIIAEIGDFYLETNYSNIWQYGSNGWSLIVNNTPHTGDNNGMKWFTGTEISGEGSNILVVIANAKKGDLYLNIDTKYVYECLSQGVWSFSYALTNIQTVEMDSSELCDYYAINSANGLAVDANNYSATSYINCKNAVSITLTLPQSSLSDIGIAFYNKNKTFIGGYSIPTGVIDSIIQTIIVPPNAVYFKTSYFDFNTRKIVDEFVCNVNYPLSQQLNKYRDYQSDFIYFSQEVNQSLDETDTTNYKATTGVLALPESYSATGKATPVIIYAHGYSHYVYYNKWGATTTFEEQKKFFTEQGFAVLGCNGARNNNKQGGFPSGGAPQFARAYKQCLDYVLENYNLDANNVFVVGGSAGGPTAIDIALTYQDNVKALVLIAAWTDIYDYAWGQNVRNNFVEYLGFNNTSTYENEKADPYNPYLLMKNDNGTSYIDDFHIPVYGLYGDQDPGAFVSKMKTFVNAINNGNPCECELFEFKGYGHEIVSGAIEPVDRKICELFKALITIDNE